MELKATVCFFVIFLAVTFQQTQGIGMGNVCGASVVFIHCSK